jgi:UDP:flavonoid glycosyltransferase YjiC (YdhE family)
MRFALVCNDTRGGVQPYVALGIGLKNAGHDVRAVAPAGLAAMFSDEGIPVVPLSGGADIHDATSIAEQGTFAAMRLMARELPDRVLTWSRETLAGCKGADVLVGGVGGRVVGLSVAERLGVPFIEAHLQPVGVRTSAYPGVLTSWFPRGPGGLGWRLSHFLSDQALHLPFARAAAKARSSLGLSGRPTAADGQPVLYGFSRHVVDVPQTAGGRERHVTGYWTLPTRPRWSPPAGLAEFLERPGPVASVGFGSMGSGDAAELAHTVAAAADDAGVRLVILSGSAGLRSESPTGGAYTVDHVPHAWLFERVEVAVHHGGAGTTAAVLRAGIPSVVVPFAVDQPFWAARVAALGAGPAPVPRRRLTRRLLADALRRVASDETMKARAAAIGRVVRAEDGVREAVEILTMRGRGSA